MRLRLGMLAAAGLVAATALVGCTGDEPDERERGDEKVVEVQDQPGSVEGYVGASDDAEVTTCEEQDGVLSVEGTVTNPEAEVQDYRIYVSAMEGADTVGLVQVDVTEVEDTADWSTEIAYDGEDLHCVLRVERFAPQ